MEEQQPERGIFPRWVYMISGFVSAMIVLAVFGQPELELSKNLMPLLALAGLSAFWVCLGQVLEAAIKRRRAATKRLKSWDIFLSRSEIIGAELELQTARGIFRSRIVNAWRDGDEVVFERPWIASYQGEGKDWENVEVTEGLNFRVAIGSFAPSRRAVDDTFFLSIPDGCMLIYVPGHSGHLRLECKVTLKSLLPAPQTTS